MMWTPMRGNSILITLIFLFIIQSMQVAGHNLSLSVRLCTQMEISTFTFNAASGSYLLKSKGATILTLRKSATLILKAEGGKIKAEYNKKTLGRFSNLHLMNGKGGFFSIKVNGAEKSYNGNLEIRVKEGKLMLINDVKLEQYVAGVVESEGGDGNQEEFYKVQGLISRTYAIKNIRKHSHEGYQLCDQVHCQLYLGRSVHREINAAVKSTQGIVIVDNNGRPISAAFHANSGGQTINSEDLWTYSEPYLRGASDSFSLGMPKALWRKKISKQTWFDYLQAKHSYPVENASMRDSALMFTQTSRKNYFPYRVPLKQIRNDFDLRSTFFDILPEGDSIIFSGRGFGHGIGLSQEGALNMARRGYPCREILEFYYRDIRLQEFTPAMIPKRP